MSATLESQQIITRLKKEGKTVYNGGLGANPLPPPQILIDTFRENVHLKQYTTPDGIPEVNESVLNHYRSGPYQPNRCLFGNGLKELLFLVQLCFEGLIIHIHPSWVSYQEQTKLLDKKTVSITTTWTHNFLLQPSQLERVCKNYPDTPKLLIFNQPTNPTGIIYSPELLQQIGEIIDRYDVTVFADEIYSRIVYQQEDYSSLSKYCPTRVLCGSSLSKEYAAGGWRAGWLTFPSEQESLYQKCYIFASSMYSCISNPLLMVIKQAMGDHPSLDIYRQQTRRIYSELARYVSKHLSENTRLHLSHPEGAWYIWLNFEDYRDRLSVKDSKQLWKKIIEKTGLVTVYGEAFGDSQLSVRYSFIDIDIDRLEEDFSTWGSRVVNATQSLIEWLSQY